MIDHEFRLVTPSLRKLVLLQSSKEKVLNSKIPFKFIRDSNIQKINNLYLKKCKLLKQIYYRGLPVNSPKCYFLQEKELKETFYQFKDKFRLKGKQIVQIPNPDYVSFKEFEKLLNVITNIHGFEVIASWHNKNINDKCYFKFLSYVQERKMPLSVEVDYFFRSSQDSLHFFFTLIKRFPNIKYWLPHLGCGIFLHWDKVMETCRHKPILLSSTNNIKEWNEIFKIKNFRTIPLVFASDHPFNGYNSYSVYKKWSSFFKKNA
jgi:hypothetical protein